MNDTKLGVRLWRKDFMPKRYLFVLAIVELASAIIELISFGWLQVDWKIKTAGYFSKRWLQPMWDAEDKSEWSEQED